MKPLLPAVALVIGAIIAVAASALVVRPVGTNSDVPASPDGYPDTGELRDPPTIEVSWGRAEADVVVTFTRVDSPTPLDCRWFVEVIDDATESSRGWTNFTDRKAWSDHPSCAQVPEWTTDPNLPFTDRDGDHNLSAGDILIIRSVAPGDETGLILAIQYWGPWLYQFRWTDAASDPGI